MAMHSPNINEPNITLEDYYLLDNSSTSARYEFYSGLLRMMSGGSPDHSIIGTNINALLYVALLERPCLVFNPDVRFKVAADKVVHPDAVVSCDPRDYGQEEEIYYPTVLVEVLSPSTRKLDTGFKRKLYLEHPTLQAYMLIDSERKHVQVYHRENGQWSLRDYTAGSTVYLEGIGVSIPFDALYRKTLLEKREKEAEKE
jgi:Uma2 family endonuclease